MSALTTEELNDLMRLDSERRADYSLETILANGEIWILNDSYGCVMLNSDDEDCVPIWPHKECAEMWSTGDWEKCTPAKISLNEWLQKWVSGLDQDELAIAIFPDLEGESLVLFPYEFEDELLRVKRKDDE